MYKYKYNWRTEAKEDFDIIYNTFSWRKKKKKQFILYINIKELQARSVF